MVKCAGYIIGEFGHLIVNKPQSSATAQWLLLRDKFYVSEEWETKQVIVIRERVRVCVHFYVYICICMYVCKYNNRTREVL